MAGTNAKTALIVAYAWIAVLLIATWFIGNLPYGVLAVVPLLIIAVYGRRLIAIVTAIILGPLEVYLDKLVPGRMLMPSGIDEAITLTVVLAGVIFVADGLRRQGQSIEFRLSRAEEDAVRDVVTQMPNRRAFQNQLTRTIESEGKFGKIAVLFADLDGFKEINDTLGHDIGDRALAAAGGRLGHMLRETDFVGRLGGDEFGVIIPRLHDRHDLERILESIETAFSMPFNVNLHRLKLGVSIGTSVYPDDGSSGQELLAKADERMYVNKRTKKMLQT